MKKEIKYCQNFRQESDFFAVAASIASYFLVGVNQRLPIITAGCISIGAGIVALLFGQDNYGRVKGNNIFRMLQLQAKSFIKEGKITFVIFADDRVPCSFCSICLILADLCNRGDPYRDQISWQFFLLVFMVLLMLGNYAVSIFTRKISNLGTSIAGIIISIFRVCTSFLYYPLFRVL